MAAWLTRLVNFSGHRSTVLAQQLGDTPSPSHCPRPISRPPRYCSRVPFSRYKIQVLDPLSSLCLIYSPRPPRTSLSHTGLVVFIPSNLRTKTPQGACLPCFHQVSRPFLPHSSRTAILLLPILCVQISSIYNLISCAWSRSTVYPY